MISRGWPCNFQWLDMFCNVLTASGDILITSALCIFLHRLRTGFRRCVNFLPYSRIAQTIMIVNQDQTQWSTNWWVILLSFFLPNLLSNVLIFHSYPRSYLLSTLGWYPGTQFPLNILQHSVSLTFTHNNLVTLTYHSIFAVASLMSVRHCASICLDLLPYSWLCYHTAAHTCPAYVLQYVILLVHLPL